MTTTRKSTAADVSTENKATFYASTKQRLAAADHDLDRVPTLRKGCRAPECKYEALTERGKDDIGRSFDPTRLGAKAIVVSDPVVTGPAGADGPILVHYGCAARLRGKARGDQVSKWVSKRWQRPGEREAHQQLMQQYWDRIREQTETGSTTERKGVHVDLDLEAARKAAVKEARRREKVKAKAKTKVKKAS